jgi:hypothetical protein
MTYMKRNINSLTTRIILQFQAIASTKNNNAEKADNVAPDTEDNEAHVGQILRDRRVAKGLRLSDVATDLRIQANYLEAIEDLEISALPSVGYVLGYVRSYANYLGLDGAKAVYAYKRDSEIPENLGMRNQPHFVPKRQLRLPKGFFAATSAMTCAATLAFWYAAQSEAQSAAITARAPIDVTTVTAVRTETIDPDMMTLKAVAPSWVQIKDAKGDVIMSRILVSGETWQTDKSAVVTLSARDGGALEVLIGEESLGILGDKGVPLQDVALPPKIDALQNAQDETIGTSVTASLE